jgi:membrane protein implicated in regulation of membrane protease activity
VTIFNRVVAVIVLLAVLVLAVALGLATQATIAALVFGVATLSSLPTAWLVPAAALIAAVALILLVAELRPRRRPILQANLEGATVEYDAGTVAGILERELSRVDGVRAARAQVLERHGKLDVLARVAVADGHDPQQVASHGASRIREALQHGLGLEVQSVRMSLQPGAAVAQREVAAEAAPPLAPSAPTSSAPQQAN